MQNPQEQTEVKLLAYIEGDLDDAGRAEIERHILANPKHRKLLDELSAGRRLVRLLPREVAPLELFESVQSQLERQELLLGAPDVNAETGNVRLNRWGQIRAAAALVLLTTGLGIIVYNAVPQRASQQAAQSPAPAPATSLARAEPELREARGSDTRVAIANRPLGSASIETTAPSERLLRMAGAAENARKSMAVREALDGQAGKLDSGAGAFANAAPTTAPSAGEPIYLVVASKDLSIARQQVAAILNDNGLAYSQIASGVAGPVTLARPLTAEQPQEIASRGAGSGGGAPAGEKTLQMSKAKVTDRSDVRDVPTNALDSQPSAAPAAGAAPTSASTLPADLTSGEEVLIVRRVPRSRASQLVAALNQPSAERYAFTYGGTAGSFGQLDDNRYRRDPASDAIARAPAAAATSPKTPIADPSQTRPTASPVLPSVPVMPNTSAARYASTAPATRFEMAKAGKATANEPAPSGIIARVPADAAANRDAESRAERPIEVNEMIELVYLDIRRAAQPLVRPTRVSTRGSIIVAGYGEFSLTGLTPQAATEKLSAVMRENSPASKGVEIRRPTTIDLTEMAQSTPPAMTAPVAPATAPQRALPAPMPTATAATPLPKPAATTPAVFSLPMPSQAAAPAAPMATVPQSSPTSSFGARSAVAEEPFVDIVIVLQRDGSTAPTP